MRRLVIRPGGIGDCLLCLPAIEELDPAEIWCPSAVVPLMAPVAPAASIASSGLDLVGIPCVAPPASVVERLRSFDEIVSWYGSNRESFQQAAFRLGLNIRFRPALPLDGSAHAVDFFLGRASGLRPRLPFTAPREDRVAIHPFSGGAKKNWPLERFRALPYFPIGFTAGPEERLADAVRFDHLDDLARWLASASLYIGNDSGITHLAAAVGTPTVALFGPTDPAVWGPRGEHVRILKAGSLEEITVEDVLAAGRDLGIRGTR